MPDEHCERFWKRCVAFWGLMGFSLQPLAPSGLSGSGHGPPLRHESPRTNLPRRCPLYPQTVPFPFRPIARHIKHEGALCCAEPAAPALGQKSPWQGATSPELPTTSILEPPHMARQRHRWRVARSPSGSKPLWRAGGLQASVARSLCGQKPPTSCGSRPRRQSS